MDCELKTGLKVFFLISSGSNFIKKSFVLKLQIISMITALNGADEKRDKADDARTTEHTAVWPPAA